MFVVSLIIGYVVLNAFCTIVMIVSTLKHTEIKYIIQQKISGEEVSKERITREVKSIFSTIIILPLLTGWLSLIIDWIESPKYSQAFFTNIEKIKKLPLETSLGREYPRFKPPVLPDITETTRNIYKLGNFYSCGCQKAVLKPRLLEQAKDISEYNSERAEAYLVQLEAFNKINRNI